MPTYREHFPRAVAIGDSSDPVLGLDINSLLYHGQTQYAFSLLLAKKGLIKGRTPYCYRPDIKGEVCTFERNEAKQLSTSQ